jgi:hypothetical protein
MNQAQYIFVPLRFQVEVFSGRDVSSSSRTIQFDDHLPPTYDSSSRPENNVTDEAFLDDVLPGYEDTTRGICIENTPIEGPVEVERGVADFKGKSAE